METAVQNKIVKAGSNIQLFKRVSLKEKVVFCREISNMLTSGLHLTQALTVIENQTKNLYFKDIIGQVKTDIEEGNQFSKALQRYPTIFDKVILNVVRSGEASGHLDKQLGDLGLELDRQDKFISSLKSAMVYPAIIVIMMIAVGIFATVKIIPSLKGVLEESGATLPWTTKLVLAMSSVMIHQWYLIILGLALIFGGIYYLLKSPEGQVIFDRWLINEPTGLAKMVYMARFSRTLGMLMESGVPIIDAVKIVAEVMNNHIYAMSLQGVASDLEKGVPLSAPILKDPKIYPNYVAQMLMVGEQTGNVDKSLTALANYYEEAAETSVKNASSWLEPVIIVIVGLGVAFLVFAILMPVYNAALSIH